MNQSWGSESCERLLPSARQVSARLKKSAEALVFLTPPVTESGLERLRVLLPLFRRQDDVMINDLGVLALANRICKARLFVGRILGRMVVMSFQNAADDPGLERELFALLGRKVKGIEVDSFNKEVVPAVLKTRWEIRACDRPLLLSVTRRCIFNTRAEARDKFGPCRKECQRSCVVAGNSELDRKFVFSGNAIFGGI